MSLPLHTFLHFGTYCEIGIHKSGLSMVQAGVFADRHITNSD
ncbi:hypothetical protein Y11_36211 [Yersinia enterocolitica subsp. palearctica Y11]|uniref:Uncharacterized protein n=1 Tax=Yersinia enterocolitica subsp. palearctica serotype O:3 (strain DSM 13030 / CIP 106945 / Y11) TaxID=930944 RepID=A0A0H3P0S2_YERE1|nr:hypothetical protein FORC065_0415 [Yersinia enterocolitica]UXD31314.1 hypothetical protein FORC066_4111 [Yersinia enterocolitica]CBY28909.1 hypothetical protein Y11_36211 [Yersinia enterocolitica subsp. palearctica Y11]